MRLLCVQSEGRIPGAELQVWSPSSLQLQPVPPPDLMAEESYWVRAVRWVGEVLCVAWQGRGGDTVLVTLAGPGPSYSSRVVQQAPAGPGPAPAPQFSTDLREVIYKSTGLMRGPVSNTTVVSVRLTPPGLQVAALLTWTHGAVFFLGAGRPGTRHLYRLETGAGARAAVCLTCHLAGPSCGWNTVLLSPGGQRAVQHCHGPGLPFTRLLDTTADPAAVLTTLDTNAALNRCS